MNGLGLRWFQDFSSPQDKETMEAAKAFQVDRTWCVPNEKLVLLLCPTLGDHCDTE